MRRRDFVVRLGGAALAWPLAARAQRPRVPRIGVLILGETTVAFREAFHSGLRELGYIEGTSILIEWRSVKRADLADAYAAELAALKVDVIVATPTLAVEAAKKATKTIPIVMAPVGDPIGAGFIASLARPGGNITGVTNLATEFGGKLLELIRELRPGVRRVAVVVQAKNPSFSPSFLRQFQSAAKNSDIHVEPITAEGPEDLNIAFTAMTRKRVGAAVLTPTLATKLAADLSVKLRIPSITTGIATRTYPQLGGVMSYGPNPDDDYRRAAGYVDKILKGAKPAELPVEQPTRFELIVNLNAAKALGLVVPRSILQRADKVIE